MEIRIPVCGGREEKIIGPGRFLRYRATLGDDDMPWYLSEHRVTLDEATLPRARAALAKAETGACPTDGPGPDQQWLASGTELVIDYEPTTHRQGAFEAWGIRGDQLVHLNSLALRFSDGPAPPPGGWAAWMADLLDTAFTRAAEG